MIEMSFLYLEEGEGWRGGGGGGVVLSYKNDGFEIF